MRLWSLLFVCLCALIALPTSVACGTHCVDFCADAPTTSKILETNGLLVGVLDTSCTNFRLSGTQIIADMLDASKTCHVEITLSDAEHFSFDVPFTNHINQCCCASCTEGFAADWQMITAGSPFESVDASPFAPSDASDAADD